MAHPKTLVLPGNKLANVQGDDPMECNSLHSALRTQEHYQRQGYRTTIELTPRMHIIRKKSKKRKAND